MVVRRKNKILRYSFILSLTFILLFLLSSCDMGLKIIDVQVGKFPDNIVYYANEDTSLNMAGCTLIFISYDTQSEVSVYDGHCQIESDIDFTKPGIYEVIFHYGEFSDRIPVQVIQR